MVFIAFLGIGCGVNHWSICMIQKQNKNKICSMAKHNSHTYYAWDWLNVTVHVVEWG